MFQSRCVNHTHLQGLLKMLSLIFFLLLFLFSAIKRLLQQRIKDEVATPQPAASLARLLRQHPIRLWTCCEMAHIRTTTTIRQRERSKENKKSGNGSWNKTIYKKLRRLFTLAEKVKCQMRRRVEARASGAQMFSLFRHSRWLKSYEPLCAARRASTENIHFRQNVCPFPSLMDGKVSSAKANK